MKGPLSAQGQATASSGRRWPSCFLHLLLLVAVLCHGCTPKSDRTPSVPRDLFNWEDSTSLGLPFPKDILSVSIWKASLEGDHYANGAALAIFRGVLYCMWQSSLRDEDSPDTHVMYSLSRDLGRTWEEARVLSPDPGEGRMFTSGGWLPGKDSLTAYLNLWECDSLGKGGRAMYIRSEDGTFWSEPRNVRFEDGSEISGIMEQDIHRVGKRLVGAVHLSPGLNVRPIYSDDMEGLCEWRRAYFESTPNGTQSRELEPSLYERGGPHGKELVMVFRDQRSSFRKLYSVSRDMGETWSRAKESSVPDSRSKQSAGNLPDGTAFLVGNPAMSKDRGILALMLSDDGVLFDRGFLLGERRGEGPLYEGKAKTRGYSYPKSLVGEGYLFVAYSIGKEEIRLSRIPLGSLSRR